MNSNKKISTFLLLTATMLFYFGTTKTAYAYTCQQADDKSLTGVIVTVLEERIGTPTGDNEKEVILNCFRQTSKEGSNIVDTCKSGTKCKPVQVYFAQSGAELLYSYIGRIYKWAAGTIGIVAVLYLVFGGIEISAAGGDAGKIDKAKERILASLTGLVILFLSALILYTVNPNFFIK